MRRASYERMSAHDAGFLTRETPAQPMHFTLEFELDGHLTLAEVRQHVALWSGSLPTLHRRLRYPVKGRPVWVDDTHFDVARQVVGWDVDVSDPQLREAALVDLTQRLLPRDRPLWRLVVGHTGTGTVLWLSVHHALMDGGLLAATLERLFPHEPAPAQPAAWRPRRPPTRVGLTIRNVVRKLRTAPAARPVAASASGPAAPLPSSRLLAGPVHAERAIGSLQLPLHAVRAAGQHAGATVNDVFMAAVTRALRDYLPGRQCDVLPAELFALVPRNVRSADEAEAIGNRGWSIHVMLPIGNPDPAERLALLQSAISAGKDSPETHGAAGWRFDVAVTNVKLGGPFQIAGRTVKTLTSVTVPLQGENRLVATAVSYCDTLTITWTADGAVFPDISELASLTSSAFMMRV